MQIDITQIVTALIGLATAIVTAVLVPYIRQRTTAQQRETFTGIVKLAVQAAEMIYTGSGRGEEKKAYVLQYMREHGCKIDGDALNAAIEAAVLELKAGIEG